jgi:hypothetical protein
MGHSYSTYSSVYSNSKQIQEIVEKDQWKDIDIVVSYQIKVDFAPQLNKNNNKYVIKLDSDIPPNCNMTLLFPNNNTSPVLWTKSYLGHIGTFCREINDRLDKSNRAQKDPLLIITSNVSLYVFQNILGKIYLLWAKKVNVGSEYDSMRQIYENVPVLFETDGKMCIRNIFLFNETEPINLKNVEMIMPIGGDSLLFCCETDPRNHSDILTTANASIVTLTEKDTEDVTEECVDENLRILTEDEISLI